MKERYENDYSHCTVKPSEALPDGVMEVSSVSTDANMQRKGYATRLMQRVCRDADLSGIVLVLIPAVHSFYERFGFKVIQSDPIMMARAPITRKAKSQHGR